ncbi:MAG: hypothetical protein FWD36_07870 [Treponema sp.]|nr:hypothetical protein [Treponema sp.]
MSTQTIWALITSFTLVTSIYFYFTLKARNKKAFADYYSEKRKEFPWLDNYLNQNKADPAKIRPYQEGGLLGKVIFFLLIAVAGGWVLTAVISFLWYLVDISTPLVKSGIIKLLVDNAGLIIAYIIGFKLMTSKDKLDSIHDIIGTLGKYLPHKFLRIAQPNEMPIQEIWSTEVPSFTLECPSCHCPHSWVMTRFQNILQGSSTTKVTTTTTRHNSADDYGGGFIGQLAAGSSTSTSTTSNTSYCGRADKDFKCLNCGHTLHENTSHIWDSYPNQDEYMYDPPKNSWDSNVAGFAKLIKMGILVLIVYMAGQFFIGFLGGANSAIKRRASVQTAIKAQTERVYLTAESNTYLFRANGDVLQRIKKGRKVLQDETRETLAEKYIPVFYGKNRGWVNSEHFK